MNLVGVKFLQMKTDLINAGNHLEGGNMAAAGTDIKLAATSLSDAMFYFYNQAGNTVRSTLNQSLGWIDTNWTGAISITMDDILNAMLIADYDQLQQFIGIEDAYRSALWDQPFNAEFYAALANGFRP
jgi:hypothetical protein